MKVALRGDMVMAPNSIKTKEEETMVIKVEERSMDMFAPAWVQESTQVLKKKVESTQVLKEVTKVAPKEKSLVLKTKVVATSRKVRKEENPSSPSRGEQDGDDEAKIIEEVAQIDQVQIWILKSISTLV